MRKSKIFCFGASVILILLAFSPLTNAVKIHSQSTKDFEIDVSIEFESCIFKDRQIKENNEIFSIYELKYTIHIEGVFSSDHDNEKIRNKFGVVDEDISFEWDDSINFAIKNKNLDFDIPRKKEIFVRSSINPELDQETFFTTKTLYHELNLLFGIDQDPSNNKDFGRAIHWNNQLDLTPSKGQVLASTPYDYIEKEEVFNDNIYSFVEIVDPFDNDYDVPEIIKDRLGYIYNLACHLFQISSDIAALFAASMIFVEQVYPNIVVITDWLITGTQIFKKALAKGVISQTALDDWLGEFDRVLEAAKNILSASTTQIPIIVTLVAKLMKDIEEFKNWIQLREWEDDIEIQLTIDLNQVGDFVYVQCRRFSEELYDIDNDKKIDESIFVSSIPTSDDPKPQKQWWIHDCTVYVSKKQTNKHTLSVLSTAFSGGKVSANFDFDVGGTRSVINELYTIKNPLILQWISSFLS